MAEKGAKLGEALFGLGLQNTQAEGARRLAEAESNFQGQMLDAEKTLTTSVKQISAGSGTPEEKRAMLSQAGNAAHADTFAGAPDYFRTKYANEYKKQLIAAGDMLDRAIINTQQTEATKGMLTLNTGLTDINISILDEIEKGRLTSEEGVKQRIDGSNKRIEEFLKTIPPELKDVFERSVAEMQARSHMQFTDGLRKTVEEKAKVNYLDSLAQVTQLGGVPYEEKRELVKEVTRISALNTTLDPGFLHAKEVETLQEIASADVSKYAKDYGPLAAVRILEAVDKQGKYLNFEELDPSLRGSKIYEYQRQYEQEQRVQREKADRTAKNAYDLIKESVKEFRLITPEMWTQAERNTNGTQYAMDIAELKNQYKSLGYYSKASVDDPLKNLVALEGANVPRIDMMRALEPGDHQLSDRAQVGMYLREKHGLNYTPMVYAEEAEAIPRILAGKDPISSVAFINQMVSNTDLPTVAFLAQQVSKADPVTAAAIYQTRLGNRKTAAEMFRGAQIIKDGKLEPTTDIKKSLVSAYNNTVEGLANEDGSVAKKNQQAILAVYAALTNGHFDEVDDEKMEIATQAVIGRKVEGMLVPPGINDDQVADAKMSAITKAIKQAGGVYGLEDMPQDKPAYNTDSFTGPSVTQAEMLAEDAQLVQVDHGAYTVKMRGQLVKGMDGKPLVVRFPW
jgi:hypothetical protein